jgi:hypothetical protein
MEKEPITNKKLPHPVRGEGDQSTRFHPILIGGSIKENNLSL